MSERADQPRRKADSSRQQNPHHSSMADPIAPDALSGMPDDGRHTSAAQQTASASAQRASPQGAAIRSPNKGSSPHRPPATPTHDAQAPVWHGASEQDSMRRLRTLSATVAQIGDELTLTTDRLAANESLDRLELTTTLNIDDLLAREETLLAQVNGWFATLGSDLALDLALTGLEPDALPVNAALRIERSPQAALQGFLASARAVAETQGADVGASVRLTVGKTQTLLAAQALCASRPEWLGQPEAQELTTLAVWYHAAAWNRLITLGTLPLWERRGLARADDRTLVVVGDAPGYLAGLALEVVGLADSREETTAIPWLPVTRAAWRRFVERDAQMRQLRGEEGSWASAPTVVTPERLRVTLRQPGLEVTAERLATLQAGLAAAYLANNVEGALEGSSAHEVTLRFAGARPAVCRLPLRPDSAEDTDATAYQEGALARLTAWAYRDGTPDKLAIARECLSGELAAGAQVSLAQLERVAPQALEAAKANFTLYIRQNTAQYFSLRAAAQDAVASYSEATRKAVSDLTGDVVDTTYRTLGLLVAAVIADLLQPAVSLALIRIALAIYLLYVALLIGVVLRARWDRFTLEASALRARLDAMPELTEAERTRLRQPAGLADLHFRR
ncbi:MAG TPA: hypothetical protein VKQ36_06060, partial [Ktedonobacterales bacterium]|nr:hypothetical protein [Ktedonobacterales bacterium]